MKEKLKRLLVAVLLTFALGLNVTLNEQPSEVPACRLMADPGSGSGTGGY